MQRSNVILIALVWAGLGIACTSSSDLDLRAPGSEGRRIGLCLGSGCGTALVPGADKVRITRSPDEVASCKPVGNIDLKDTDANIKAFRNRVVGLGGNATMLTTGTPVSPSQGVAYLCPSVQPGN